MSYLALYLVVVVVFLGLDAVWLRKAALPLFEKHVGALMREDPDLKVAAVFYAFYCVGIVYFAAAPASSAGGAFRDGVILGLVAYGTYEATNMATLKGWHWSMVIADTAWGALLTGFAAAVAVMLVG